MILQKLNQTFCTFLTNDRCCTSSIQNCKAHGDACQQDFLWKCCVVGLHHVVEWCNKRCFSQICFFFSGSLLVRTLLWSTLCISSSFPIILELLFLQRHLCRWCRSFWRRLIQCNYRIIRLTTFSDFFHLLSRLFVRPESLSEFLLGLLVNL